MLTFESIRKILKEEKDTNKPTKLPDNFFPDIREYLDRKAAARGEELWELQAARQRLQDILDIRERKIINMALYSLRSGMIPENLSPEENTLFDSVVSLLREFQEKRKLVLEGKQEKRDVVAILNPVPKFVGVNLQTYGPFKPGDVATLPQENARLLIEKNAAEKVKTEA